MELKPNKEELNLVVRNIDRDELKRYMNRLIEIYFAGYKGLEKYAYTTPERVKKYLQWLHRSDPNGVFVAFVNHRPVGFVGGNKDWFFGGKLYGEIHEIVVDPEYRGLGIASKLLESEIDYFKNSGRKIAGLWVGVTNEAAKNFYKKHGFRYRGTYGKWERWEKELD